MNKRSTARRRVLAAVYYSLAFRVRLRSRASGVLYVLFQLEPRKLVFMALGLLALVLNVIGFLAEVSGGLLAAAVVALIVDLVLEAEEARNVLRPAREGLVISRRSTLPSVGVQGEVAIEDLVPCRADVDRGYEAVRLLPGEPVVCAPNVDKWLVSNPMIPLSCLAFYESDLLDWCRPYFPDFRTFLAIRVLEAEKRSGLLFNETKVALLTTLTPQLPSVEVGRTSYFTSLVTNEACQSQISQGHISVGDMRVLYPFDYGEPPRLRHIEASCRTVSNHIGVTLLARTSDGTLVQWYQSGRSEQNRSRVVPAATGSADWDDIKSSGGNDLLTVVRYAMARELCEESLDGVRTDPGRIARLADRICVIGFFRWLTRGGKPEFVGIIHLDVSLNEGVKPDHVEVSSISDSTGRQGPLFCINTADQLEDCCVRMIEGASASTLSLPLAYLYHRLRSILAGDLGNEARAQVLSAFDISC